MIRILGGRFELLSLLGEGGMGTVWRVRDRELDEVVALKLIRPELSASGDMVARFRSEVKLARRVTHRNVARIFEVGTLDGVAFFTMELVEGRSLAARVRSTGPLPWRDAVAVAAEIALGLEAAHAVGVVHRDVKPDNVLIEDGGRIVLTDFGIAAARASADGLLAGTAAYMAPEQAAGEPPTAAVDVYSLGVILYELLTGIPAWSGTLSEILASKRTREALEVTLPDVDAGLADVVRRATARDPARRVRSAAELRGLLSRWVDPGPVTTRPPRRRSDAAVRDLVITPPGPNSGARRYLGDAIYEQLVSRLWRSPGVRLVASWQAGVRAAPAAVVAIEVDDTITVRACDAGGQELVALRLPASAELVQSAAHAVAAALTTSLGIIDTDQAAPSLPPAAAELYLRARHQVRRMGPRAVGDAIAGFEAALVLAPGDGRLMAARAMALARQVFYARPDDVALRAAEVATADALERCPERADTQIAAGQVALHHGDVGAAAHHLRRAIAYAPYAAEAHEWLGRILLEAGHLDEGIARVETALSLDPRLELAQWEIARAYALEGDWDRYDLIARELIGQDRLRTTPWAARFALWRGDRDRARAILANSNADQIDTGLPVELISRISAAFAGDWAGQRARLLELAATPGQASARRASMYGQLVAEVAGGLGDLDACVTSLEHSIRHGFFDLHWFDRCPMLAVPRRAGVLAPLRPAVAARAQRILDALYGESPSHNATADTMAALPADDTIQSLSDTTWR